MRSFLKPSRMTLMERLALHVKKDIALEAKDFSSEPGVLQKVGLHFIKVEEQYFIPGSLQEIVLLGTPPKHTGSNVVVRSTYRGNITGKILRTGTDFVELLIPTTEEDERDWVLIPYINVISIEKS
ncbi:hypothetical protein [Paenibacillus thalictri]|uniref:Uncharacterized protein n=1 Tax=Paenibacillus thalictri TaxID=2527873 RepID=A0A4Q9DTZ3_9BACL|nr:hypothetical protein [Paenibacillus thalictri]TBL78687.1 hypothetical protein EYB31_14445 [Paenibacillus thalictri]